MFAALCQAGIPANRYRKPILRRMLTETMVDRALSSPAAHRGMVRHDKIQPEQIDGRAAVSALGCASPCLSMAPRPLVPQGTRTVDWSGVKAPSKK